MEIISSRPVAGSDLLLDEIENNFSKFVLVKDVQETCALNGDGTVDGDTVNVEEGQEDLEPCGQGPVTMAPEETAKLLCEGDDEPETALPLLFSEEATQLALPLVSAMKGSREKLGVPPRKLSVSWAPDVYDPVPTSSSHTVKIKPYRLKKYRDASKKNGKKKGNSKGGKDKKQLHKSGGSGRLGKYSKTMNTSDAPEDLVDYDVDTQDYCGIRFLIPAPINFNYSIAEAL